MYFIEETTFMVSSYMLVAHHCRIKLKFGVKIYWVLLKVSFQWITRSQHHID